MVKKVNALTARQQLSQLLEDVSARGDQYIIERAGKPMAAVVPVWFLDAWQQRRDQFFAMIDAVHARNAGVPADIIAREVTEAIQHVRHEAAPQQS